VLICLREPAATDTASEILTLCLLPALQNHFDDSVFNLLLFPELFSFDQNMWYCSNIVQAEETELLIK
jgi:hypothetical protein